MKIIKVTHNDIEIDIEKQYLSVENFNVNEFLKKNRSKIKENKSFISFLTKAIKRPKSFSEIIIPLKSEIVTVNKASEEYLDEIIRASINLFLSHIKDQLDYIEGLSLETAKKKYPNTKNLSIGTFTLHPYDYKRLTRIEHYHQNLASEKDDELVVLLGRMGAKTLRIIESDGKQRSGSGNIDVEFASVEARSDLKMTKEMAKNKELVVTFEGNIVDIAPDLLAKSLWFANDSKLNAIFESRRFNLNRIEKYTLKNTYTETFDFDFNVASKYLTTSVDLKAEYNALSGKERLFYVEFGH